MATTDGVKIGDYLLSEIMRRVRRTADLSQRELAKHAGVSNAMVGSIEAGTATPSLPILQRLLNTAGYRLVVVDVDGRLVVPLQVWQDVTDLAGRRFPAHLDTILDPVFGEWWADVYGLTAPPETFRRSRPHRDWIRRVSRWEVRVAQLRNEPIPDPPRGIETYRRVQQMQERRAYEERVATGTVLSGLPPLDPDEAPDFGEVEAFEAGLGEVDPRTGPVPPRSCDERP